MLTFALPYAGRPRRFRIHVPPGVGADPPLLVLFDGQNVFADRGSYAGGWYAHSAVDALPSTVRRPVVVAVDHGGKQRIRELWSRLDPFLAFVIGEVLPVVADRTGAGMDPRWTVVGGSSMGGLAALATLLRHPGRFGGALCMSPSLWVDHAALLGELRQHPPSQNARIYLDAGEKEPPSMARQARRLAGELQHRIDAEHLMWRPDKRGTHQERHWRRRLPKALRFLFHR